MQGMEEAKGIKKDETQHRQGQCTCVSTFPFVDDRLDAESPWTQQIVTMRIGWVSRFGSGRYTR